MSRGRSAGMDLLIYSKKNELRLLVKPIKLLFSKITEKNIKKTKDLTKILHIGTTEIYWNKRRSSLYSKRIEEFVEKDPLADSFVNNIADSCRGPMQESELKNKIRSYLNDIILIVYLPLIKNKFDPHPIEKSVIDVIGISDSSQDGEIYRIAKLLYNLMIENEN